MARLLVVFLVVLLTAPFAGATTIIPNGTTGLNYVTGGVQLVDGPGAGTFIGRTFATPSATGSVAVTESVGGIQLGGRAITASVARTVTMPEIAAGAAAAGAAFYAGCAVGTAIANAAGMGSAGNGARVTCNVTDWLFDAGQPSQTMTAWTYVRPGASDRVGGGASAAEACTSWANADWAFFTGSSTGGQVFSNFSGGQLGTVTATSAVCSYRYDYVNPTTGLGGSGTRSTTSLEKTTGQLCPASIDALNPAWSIPAGSSPGPDGKCATGRYNATDSATVRDRLATYGTKAAMNELLKWLLDHGATITTAAPRSITGVTPPNATLSPITTNTTNPDGTTTTVTKTPTVTYTTSGDTITYNTTYTTVTQTCAGAGSCTSSTSTTTTPSAAQQTDQQTDCDKRPNSIGCSEYGTPGTDKPVWVEKTVTYAPENLGFTGACPVPEHWHLPHANIDLDWSYQPACDVAPIVRAGLLALVGLGALLFIVQTVRA